MTHLVLRPAKEVNSTGLIQQGSPLPPAQESLFYYLASSFYFQSNCASSALSSAPWHLPVPCGEWNGVMEGVGGRKNTSPFPALSSHPFL